MGVGKKVEEKRIFFYEIKKTGSFPSVLLKFSFSIRARR